VARTYKTLSLSLPPEAVRQLEERARDVGKTAARVAAEVVLRELSLFEPISELQLMEGQRKMVHQCIVHERDSRGMISRQYQAISLLDITRIRSGRSDVVEVFIGGVWLEIEAKIDEFQATWEQAKASAAGATATKIPPRSAMTSRL
jgi:hypothetical protein